MCLDALLFRKSMHKELQFWSFKDFMLDPLEEPKHSAPNLYASDLAPCQIVSMGNSYHGLHHNGFGLINLSNFTLLITFLAILDFVDGVHISNIHSSKHIYIYIYACKG